MKLYFWALISGIAFSNLACAQKHTESGNDNNKMKTMDTLSPRVTKTDEEWKKLLTPVQYTILREKGTELPFTGIYENNYKEGTYFCAACKSALFSSKTKFDAGCGWPSFFAPLLENNVNIKIDRSLGMIRYEVQCAHCGGHLGHVFNDGPKPTGRRYCINSGALIFKPKNEKDLPDEKH
jgi:peptide-methionine (R)-S-oxide reductase